MWSSMDLAAVLESSPTLLILLTITTVIIAIPLYLKITTTLAYRHSLNALTNGSDAKLNRPPVLPYSIPVLGSSLSFLSPQQGKFWRFMLNIFNQHPLLSAITVLLPNFRAHVLYSPSAVNAFFKNRELDREQFNVDIVIMGMGMNKSDARQAYHIPNDKASTSPERAHRLATMQTDLFAKHLLNQSAVNILIEKFMTVFQDQLAAADDDLDSLSSESKGWKQIDLIAWLKHKMFIASTTALYGRSMLAIPDLERNYWDFDLHLMTRLYRVPRLLAPRAYESVERLNAGIEEWVKMTQERFGGKPPLEPDWDEHLGARIVRARRYLYQEMGISTKGMATFDIGFLFG
jgi:hypothetical protein